jgi:hypothetical protein
MHIIGFHSYVPNPDNEAFFGKTAADVSAKIAVGRPICQASHPFGANHKRCVFDFFVRNVPQMRNQIFAANSEIIKQPPENQPPTFRMQQTQLAGLPIRFYGMGNGKPVASCDKKSVCVHNK